MVQGDAEVVAVEGLVRGLAHRSLEERQVAARPGDRAAAVRPVLVAVQDDMRGHQAELQAAPLREQLLGGAPQVAQIGMAREEEDAPLLDGGDRAVQAELMQLARGVAHEPVPPTSSRTTSTLAGSSVCAASSMSTQLPVARSRASLRTAAMSSPDSASTTTTASATASRLARHCGRNGLVAVHDDARADAPAVGGAARARLAALGRRLGGLAVSRAARAPGDRLEPLAHRLGHHARDRS